MATHRVLIKIQSSSLREGLSLQLRVQEELMGGSPSIQQAFGATLGLVSSTELLRGSQTLQRSDRHGRLSSLSSISQSNKSIFAVHSSVLHM